MKTVLISCVSITCIFALAVLYSTAKGYTSWYWRNSHAVVLVDGRQVSGYVHRSVRKIILTRRDLAKPRSYWIDTTPPSTARPHYCGSWSAPNFFVFVVGDLNMPCMGLTGIESTQKPRKPLIRQALIQAMPQRLSSIQSMAELSR
jgi:hypothetical protein